jgi:hypothetical protein
MGMNLNDVVQLLSPTIIVGPANPSRVVTGGYTSDLLSYVMAKAKAGNVWITIQGHPNIVAVASLLDLAGIIVCEGASVDDLTIQKATEEGIPLFSSTLSSFSVVAKLASAGLAGADM